MQYSTLTDFYWATSHKTNIKYLILWNDVVGEVDQTAELPDDTINQDTFNMLCYLSCRHVNSNLYEHLKRL